MSSSTTPKQRADGFYYMQITWTLRARSYNEVLQLANKIVVALRKVALPWEVQRPE